MSRGFRKEPRAKATSEPNLDGALRTLGFAPKAAQEPKLDFTPEQQARFRANVEAMLGAEPDEPPMIKPSVVMGQGQGREYPLPAGALGIWLVGAELKVAVPGLPGISSGHTLSLPLDKLRTSDESWCVGWRVLLSLLQDRERLRREAHHVASIGNRAAPVQHDVDRALVRRFDATGKREVSFDELFGEDSS